jgi:hypothetical protein
MAINLTVNGKTWAVRADGRDGLFVAASNEGGFIRGELAFVLCELAVS